MLDCQPGARVLEVDGGEWKLAGVAASANNCVKKTMGMTVDFSRTRSVRSPGRRVICKVRRTRGSYHAQQFLSEQGKKRIFGRTCLGIVVFKPGLMGWDRFWRCLM